MACLFLLVTLALSPLGVSAMDFGEDRLGGGKPSGAPSQVTVPAPGSASGTLIQSYGLQGAPASARAQGVRLPPNPALSAAVKQLTAILLSAQAAATQTATRKAEQTTKRNQGLSNLQARAGGEVKLRLRPNVGTPRWLEGKSLEKAVAFRGPADERARRTALSFLTANRDLLLLDEPSNELKLMSNTVDSSGRRHLYFEQHYAGLRVWPGEVLVHTDAEGNVELLNGAYAPTPSHSLLEATVSANEAIEYARRAVPEGSQAETTEPELLIYAPLDAEPRLAWKLAVNVSLISRWKVLIDAENGDVLQAYNNVQSQAVTGSGVDLAGQNRPLSLWQDGNGFYMVDTSKPMFNQNGTSMPPNPNAVFGGIMALDFANQAEAPGLVGSNGLNGPWLPDAVSAAYLVGRTYDYFRVRHGRNSLNDQHGNINTAVRFQAGPSRMDNAFWNSDQNLMVFGDAQPWAAEFNIVAHELTHGVIDTTRGSILEYHDQSGALNESMADIFGVLAEAWATGNAPDWQLGGENISLLRDMKNPGSLTWADNRPYPKKMSEFAQLPNTREGDNGGVHINSSINNHAFYLVAEGLPGAIGRTKSADIFYKALTRYLLKLSQFVDMRLAAVQSAEDIYGAGSVEAQKMKEAYDRVEIFDGTATPEPPPIPEVNAADSLLFVTTVSFQGSDFDVLARLETAQGDPEAGSVISHFDVGLSPPSVTGDGTLAFFVNSVSDICVIRTDASEAEKCLGLPTLEDENNNPTPVYAYSVAVAPDGSKAAVVLHDGFGNPENIIHIVSISTGEVASIGLQAPSIEGTQSNAIAATQGLTFHSNGQILIYDALNSLRLADGTVLENWSIYEINLETMQIGAVILPVTQGGFSMGNPSLSRTSNNHLLFESAQVDPAGDIVPGSVKVHALDLADSTTSTILENRPFLSFPKYSGNDRAVIATFPDENQPTGASIVRVELQQDKITPAGGPSVLLPDAAFGVIYRRGTFVGSGSDADGDGVPDSTDNCPDDPNPNQGDLDNDGMGNLCDPDDDNDETPDSSDPFPNDPTETTDTDVDGIGNNADLDDDGDGYPDTVEIAEGSDPLDPASIPGGAGPPTLEAFNTKGGYPAYLAEPANADLFSDGICDEATAFEHWRDGGFAAGRGFADGQLRTDNADGSPDSDYAIDGGFSWEYPGANTVVFITANAPKPEGWDGRSLLLERCQTFNIGSHYTAQAYRTINVDVAQAIDGGLIPGFDSVTDHYVKYGFKEGRLTNSDWGQAELEAWVDANYFEQNRDVETYFLGAQSEGWVAFGKIGFAHWINFGRYEGRNDGQ